MNVAFKELNKAFENRIRLGIMSVLAVNDFLDFNALKEFLGVTDGNLASHIKKLEGEKFIGVKKSFKENKPNTRYYMTAKGKKAFEQHLQALEAIIKSNKEQS